MEGLCGIPVVGVIPYMHLDIDDEDSLSERFSSYTTRKSVDIAVIKLPRISNFTDFSPFEHYDNVSLRYVDRVSELHRPDMIFLPGTKSTISDLMWLRETGLEAAVLKAADAGTVVFGICGGYQMLGKKISDPAGSESAEVPEISGMGLLDHDTVFDADKVRRQTEGVFDGIEGFFSDLNGKQYRGYEIHMGRDSQKQKPIRNSGNIYGTYIHGIFDGPGISDTILAALCRKKGITPESLNSFDPAEYKQQQYDLLADTVRANLDMDLIYRIIERTA